MAQNSLQREKYDVLLVEEKDNHTTTKGELASQYKYVSMMNRGSKDLEKALAAQRMRSGHPDLGSKLFESCGKIISVSASKMEEEMVAVTEEKTKSGVEPPAVKSKKRSKVVPLL